MSGDMKNRDLMDDALRQLYNAPVPASFLDSWQNAVTREENESMSQKKNAPKFSVFFKRAVLPIAAALVLVVGALWVDGQDLSTGTEAASPMTRKGAAMYSTAGNGVASNSYTMAESAGYDSAAMDGGMATGGMVLNDMGTVNMPTADAQRKLVRTASLTLRTARFDDDFSALNALVTQLGGYVENTYQSGDSQSGDARHASITVRIPSDQLDAFLSGAGDIGRVVNSSQSATDMTVQYADNQARLNTLQAKLTRLNELLSQAENVADIVEIESAISNTQYMIDSYETTQRTIDRQVDMSQVDVSLLEDSPVAITSEMSMGERLSAALSTSVAAIGRFLRNMLVFVVMALPVLIPLIVVILLVVILKRRCAAKRPAQSNEPPKEEV